MFKASPAVRFSLKLYETERELALWNADLRHNVLVLHKAIKIINMRGAKLDSLELRKMVRGEISAVQIASKHIIELRAFHKETLAKYNAVMGKGAI